MNTCKKFHRIVCIVLCTCFISQARSETNVKVEIIQPFEKWFLTEDVDFYVRVSNVGKDPIRLIGISEVDLFFEVDPKATTLSGDTLQLPKVEQAKEKKPGGLVIPPGKAYVMNDAGYNAADFVASECFTRVRVHLLLEPGKCVSSDWVDREIIPTPKIDQPSLYDFHYSSNSSTPKEVIQLPISDESWLFAKSKEDSKRVGSRLCRVPKGLKVADISHDMESRRLTIQFVGNEEPVVINTRSGLPVSGSERTVPHLHLWKKISGRPYTDFYQRMMELREGRQDEWERSRTLVPVEISASPTSNRQPTQEPVQGPPLSDANARSGTQDGAGSKPLLILWLTGLAAIALLAGWWLVKRSSRSGRSA